MLNLENKNLDVESTAKVAIEDVDSLKTLLAGILSKDDIVRSNSFESLLFLSKMDPEFLYLHWDFFKEMLYSKNNYSKYISVYILANLTLVDDENKFEEIFEDYFALLGGTRAMISSHVALNSAVIFRNKPDLRPEILNKLLDIDNIHEGKQIEMIKSYVIGALSDIYNLIDDKKSIGEFVKNQRDSKSPKTRKMADEFLNQRG
ncbi:MAG: hypothetical protein Q7V10_07335 [Methanobacteriaceae archaeon]|jgi:hypothetical protein|nr:hypothetical protein [Methanobacteriaceae archaeon]MDO9626861.1 hypothetical protein [Methanobacteriaceae archaeon]